MAKSSKEVFFSALFRVVFSRWRLNQKQVAVILTCGIMEAVCRSMTTKDTRAGGGWETSLFSPKAADECWRNEEHISGYGSISARTSKRESAVRICQLDIHRRHGGRAAIASSLWLANESFVETDSHSISVRMSARKRYGVNITISPIIRPSPS